MAHVRISVCIPTVRTNTVKYAVRSVLRQTFQDWELVVIGQGNEADLSGATARAASGDPRVRYLHLDHLGLSAARNAGFRATSGEIVAFTDDDCEAQDDWLARLDEYFTPDIGFVCGTVEAPSKARRGFARCPSIRPGEVVFVPGQSDQGPPAGFNLLGANMAVRRTEAEKVGLFDECLGAGSTFGGGEEHDLVSRLAQHGVQMRSSPRPVVRHSYGYRYGIRSVYSHRRDLLRGDGAIAGKRTLMMKAPGVELSVRDNVLREARAQLGTIRLRRLPNNVFRLFYYLTSYRECLVGYELSDSALADPATAILQPRPTRGLLSRLIGTVPAPLPARSQ
jgi:glycosyltransferase involved in cell wall biosynthesis